MPCPRCGDRIAFTIEALLVERRFCCPTCSGVLTLDSDRSEKGLRVLEKFIETRRSRG